MFIIFTGKYRPGDENYLTDGGLVADDFSSAVDMILKTKETSWRYVKPRMCKDNIEGVKVKGSKCYWANDEIEPVCIHSLLVLDVNN